MSRLSVFAFVAALLLGTLSPAPPQAMAGWQPEGVSVCQSHCDNYSIVAPDGTGGAFVVWRFEPPGSGGSNPDIYARRLTASGDVAAGWIADDLPVCTAPSPQQGGGIVSDGTGGLIVTWQDHRNAPTTSADIYAQRILGDGTIAPGWAVNGMPASQAAGYQADPVVVADGLGGAFITWRETDQQDVHVQHLTISGVPAPEWPSDGLPVCTDPNPQSTYLLVSDGADGVVVAWGDSRDGQGAGYAQRVTAAGQALWQDNGVRLILGRYIRNLVTDDAGGVYLSSTGVDQLSFDSTFYLQRFTPAGETAQGWPAEGIPVCVAPGWRIGLQMVADGAGGALLAWIDVRDYYIHGPELYIQRVRPDGTLPPEWPVDGLRLTHNFVNELMQERDGALAADGIGGAYVCYRRNGTPTVLHVTGTGQVAAGWPAEGWPVASSSTYYGQWIVADGMGGALVTWGQLTQQSDDLRAQRYGIDGPVAVQVSLASSEATPEHVALTWQGPGAGGLIADVERRSTTGAWMRLGSATPDGADRLLYEDRAVTPGARYAYRLGWREGDAQQFSAESWVDVPRALELALAGFRPNPAPGTPMVALTLADGSPASLDVLDVSGRRIVSRDVGGLGPGAHTIRLDGTAFAPGMYWLRLEQSGLTRRVRGLVVR